MHVVGRSTERRFGAVRSKSVGVSNPVCRRDRGCNIVRVFGGNLGARPIPSFAPDRNTIGRRAAVQRLETGIRTRATTPGSRIFQHSRRPSVRSVAVTTDVSSDGARARDDTLSPPTIARKRYARRKTHRVFLPTASLGPPRLLADGVAWSRVPNGRKRTVCPKSWGTPTTTTTTTMPLLRVARANKSVYGCDRFEATGRIFSRGRCEKDRSKRPGGVS